MLSQEIKKKIAYELNSELAEALSNSHLAELLELSNERLSKYFTALSTIQYDVSDVETPEKLMSFIHHNAILHSL